MPGADTKDRKAESLLKHVREITPIDTGQGSYIFRALLRGLALPLTKEITVGDDGGLRILLRGEIERQLSGKLVFSLVEHGENGAYIKLNGFRLNESEVGKLGDLYSAAPEYVVRPLATIRAEDGTFSGYVMEKARGVSLYEFMEGMPSEHDWEFVLSQIRDFLKLIHDKGLYHGDIKGDNIFVGPGLRIKVIDPLMRTTIEGLQDKMALDDRRLDDLIYDMEVMRKRAGANAQAEGDGPSPFSHMAYRV